MAWACAVSKPNHEAIAAVNLQRQGFDYYYPRFKSQKRPSDSPVIRPLFPRYIFVHIENQWRSINGTRGISYVLLGEEGPLTVLDTIIKGIKGREVGGLYQLVAPPMFQPGDTVKTTEGPLLGLPLIYEGMEGHERVRVLVDMFGQMSKATIEEKLLVAA